MSEEKSTVERVRESLGELGIERSVDEPSVAFGEDVPACESDKLRTALDERGIKYTCKDREEDFYNDKEMETSWSDGRFGYLLTEFFRGEKPVTTQLSMRCKYGMTAEQAIAATVGRSCASCPEMGNPDSYIRHLSAALEYRAGRARIASSRI